MTEQREFSRTGVVFEVLLVILDYLQLFSLILSSDPNWNPVFTAWVRDAFTLSRYISELRSPSAFTALFILCTLMVWVAMLDAAYVSYIFQTNSFDHLWPIRMLRVLVTYLVTVGFIPVVDILVLPTSCSKLSEFVGQELVCDSGWLQFAQVLSLLSLIAFVPFCLTMSLVFVSTSSRTRSVFGLPSGALRCLLYCSGAVCEGLADAYHLEQVALSYLLQALVHLL